MTVLADMCNNDGIFIAVVCNIDSLIECNAVLMSRTPSAVIRLPGYVTQTLGDK